MTDDDRNSAGLLRSYRTPERTFDLRKIGSAEIWNMFAGDASQQKFPIGAFPGPAGDFYCELCERHPGLEDLVIAQAAATFSGATQGHGDVELPWDDKPRPLGLYILMAAPPFAGKSFVEDAVSGMFGVFSEERLQIFSDEGDGSERAIRDWKRNRKLLEKEANAAQTPDERSAAEQKLDELYGSPPQKPRLRPFIVTDLTSRALAELLHGNGEWLALMTSEGANIIESPFFDNTTTLSDIFEGKTVRMARGHGKYLTASNAGLAMGISMQDDLLIEALQRRFENMQKTGFLSRLLILLHKSSISPEPSPEPWIHKGAYDARLLEMLRTAPLCASGRRPSFAFEPSAAELLCNIKAGVHAAISPEGKLAGLRSYLSRTPDMIARMATSFHIFEKRQDRIPAGTVEQAASVISFLAKENARVGHVELPAAQFASEKNLVERHVLGRLAATDGGRLGWDQLYRSTTTKMRNRPGPYFDIMRALENEGKIIVYHDGGSRMVGLPPRCGWLG